MQYIRPKGILFLLAALQFFIHSEIFRKLGIARLAGRR